MDNLKELLDNSLLLVESPAKIKVFEKYIKPISKTCKVLASAGHIRNLQPKKDAIDIDNNFKMKWENTVQSRKVLPNILKAAEDAEKIIIATDPDREGEAIGWHLCKYFKQKKIVKPTYRILFHSLTKEDILNALSNPVKIRQHLVEAYLARLSLDFLVGFNISPLLWRKLPGCMSAGRVQSAALKNIVELEYKIQQFKPEQYFVLNSDFKIDSDTLEMKLTHFPYAHIKSGCVHHPLKQTDYIIEQCKQYKYHISDITKSQRKKSPPPPFITSTLQQDASSKLKLSPKQTMQLAQKLYEGIKVKGELIGLITYMRTDSISMSPTAIKQCRQYISKNKADFLTEKERFYKTSSKNTQEAHECIRPTDFNITPDIVKKSTTDSDLVKLYELIWNRSVASQMKDAIYTDQVVSVSPTEELGKEILKEYQKTLKIKVVKQIQEESDEEDDDKEVKAKKSNESELLFQTKTTQLSFTGWMSLYNTRQDKVEFIEYQQYAKAILKKITPDEKYTQPPSRYTAASLIARMYKLGIGRPGTYTNILDILTTRQYITKHEGYMKPTQKSWFLIGFLEKYFSEYIEYEFTASMEDTLDQIANNDCNWLDTMNKFWEHFSAEVQNAASHNYEDMREFLENLWHDYFFQDVDKCQKCGAAAQVRFWKGNGFLSCTKYPTCNWVHTIEHLDIMQIGEDPETHQQIELVTDQYENTYLHWKPLDDQKAKYITIPAILKTQFNKENINLKKVLKLKQLPMNVGKHPDTGKDIVVAIGKFGPYIKYDDKFISLKANPLDVTLRQCVDIIAKHKVK